MNFHNWTSCFCTATYHDDDALVPHAILVETWRESLGRVEPCLMDVAGTLTTQGISRCRGSERVNAWEQEGQRNHHLRKKKLQNSWRRKR